MTDAPRVSVLLWSYWSDSLLNYRKVHRTFLPNLPSSKLHGKFGVRFSSGRPNEKETARVSFHLELVAGLEPATCALRNCAGKVKIVIYSGF